ncbi:FecR family protein [Roseateles sp. DC23W]|uniref:FecR family protein n=1 Tax=Pelomonas dachongensis TaxID=3299029 RepID=A0ABW7EXC3_9BURK
MTREILAEAAVWVTRLHGPERSRAMERECLAWQAQSTAHRLAFERCTDTWQEVGGLSRAQIQAAVGKRRSAGSLRGRAGRVAVGLAMLCLAAVSVVLLWPGHTYGTGVGEQRMIILADGSRMTLNTSTEARVRLTDSQRTVTVEHGEALFEVAKDAGRPFVVKVADAQVVATGTQFLVRSTPPAEVAGDAFGITLIEGQVTVQRSAGSAHGVPEAPVVMAPGERLRVALSLSAARQAPAQIRLDRPQLDRLLAWNRGFVMLDGTTLPEAVAEMNRYSRVPITLRDQETLNALRISGTFRTGDNNAFAQAVARLFDLVVTLRDGGLELASK